MGMTPLIYDRPQVAPLMNLINGQNYTWVGPFEYEEMLYMQGKLPTKYHVLLPGIGRSTEMQQQMVEDLNTNKPVGIWFDENFHILGYRAGDYGKLFTEFLDANYINLYQYRDWGHRHAPNNHRYFRRQRHVRDAASGVVWRLMV